MGGNQRTTPSRPFALSLTASILTLPSDEHERRSPNCAFFTLSASSKPTKAGKPRKGRASKASRLSTQSNFTVASDAISIAETEAHNDSVMSVAEVSHPGKTIKGGKKGLKAKKSTAKSKSKNLKATQDETQIASSFIEPEDDDFEVKVATPAPNAKKRRSEEMEGGKESNAQADPRIEQLESQPPPKKRRATRTRSSVAHVQNPPETIECKDENEPMLDVQMTDVDDVSHKAVIAPKKRGRGGKNRSSIARKASAASTASKASLRAEVPNNAEIEAALEEDLDRPLTDDDAAAETPEIKQLKGRRLTRNKPGPKQATASIAPTRRTTRASTIVIDDSSIDLFPAVPDVPGMQETSPEGGEGRPSKPLPVKECGKKKVSRKASAKQVPQERDGLVESPREPSAASNDRPDHEEKPATQPKQTRGRQGLPRLAPRNGRASGFIASHDAADLSTNVDSSVLGTQTAEDDSGHETDASVVTKARPKREPKKGSAAAKKPKGGRKPGPKSRNVEEYSAQPVTNVPESQENQEDEEGMALDQAGVDLQISGEPEERKKQPKASKAAAKSSKSKKGAAKPRDDVSESQAAPPLAGRGVAVEKEATTTSPRLTSKQSTPRLAPSPQSSDAENKPPSSRPSSQRPPLSALSPSKTQAIHIPLAASTPTKSPSRAGFSKLQSTLPWTAVDIEQIFQGTLDADQEFAPFALGNAGAGYETLTSPEKKLTVEQWINFNAQRGDEKLRSECERLVGRFEGEGVRALRTLEGITCID